MLSKQSLVGGHLVPRSRRTRNCRSSGIVSKGSKPSELRPALISPRLPELSTHLDTHLSCSASRTPRRLITRGTELKRAAESSEVARCLRFDRRGKNTTGTNNAAQNPLFARHPSLFSSPHPPLWIRPAQPSSYPAFTPYFIFNGPIHHRQALPAGCKQVNTHHSCFC